MEIKDYFLACISEEAGEIVQAVGKSHRFGLLDTNPITGATNWVELRKEVHDLIAVYEMLCDEFDRVETLDRELIEKKKSKVLCYIDYSEERGRLDNKETRTPDRDSVLEEGIKQMIRDLDYKLADNINIGREESALYMQTSERLGDLLVAAKLK